MPHTITLPAEPAREHRLIDAVLAINAAPTLARAFQVLAETGRELLSADRFWVVVWTDELTSGEVVAAAGTGDLLVGETVPLNEQVIEAMASGEPFAGPPILDGLSPELARRVGDIATVVSVPLLTESCRATFHAGWAKPLDGQEATEGAHSLHTLTRLTTLAERTLRQHDQDQLTNVLDGVADGVVLTTGGPATMNAAARAILAVPNELDFRPALIDPRTLEGRPYGFETDGAPGSRFTIRATALDGRELVLDGSVSPVGGGAVIVFRDVTDEHARNQLNEETLSALFNSIPTAISVTRPDSGEIVTVNRAFCELVGRTADELVGLRPPFPWSDESAEELGRRFVPGATADRVYRDPDERPVPVRLSVHAVLGDDGETALLLALIENLSEERRMQQQLIQSGKLAAIGELAAGVAHEINNPLFAILGLTEFLLKESEPGSKAHTRLELIQQTGLEIKEIVRALLDFARENAEERYLVSLEDVVRSTVDLVRRTNANKGVELVDAYEGTDMLVNASPNQLKQIFLNLIANARQAMPSGGTVSVEVRSSGSLAIATVRDDGPGIDSAVAERIFEPFFTTKRLTGGTGLGLSVSLGIAEAHGGQLTVDSQPGKGATFTLCLPTAEEDPS